MTRGKVVVALFHAHVLRAGEVYNCPLLSTEPMIADPFTFGGGSPQDWGVATVARIPLYAMDPDGLYRFEPDTDSLYWEGNPNRWLTGTFGTCSQPAPF